MPKINSISPDKHNYLQILSDIDENITTLFYIGTLPPEKQPTVAIVGSRKPTGYGREVAYRLSHDLSSRGVIIVSGLALGIDGIAHQAALDAGGTTIGVLAGGLDRVYPAQHAGLAQSIVNSGGALLSEYEEGVPPMQHRFLERNRIGSGLSDVVIVVEAAARSGTLSTARWALEQGKTVMAVPGNITSPTSAGCNWLIKTGALPITGADDVLHALGVHEHTAQRQLPLAENTEEQAIIKALASGLRDGDELQQKSGLDAATFSQTLTMMEITGKIRALGANQWTLG